MQRLLVSVLLLSPSLASAQAAIFPEWLGRETEAWSGSREPQVRDADALFDAARALELDALDDALIVCRINVREPDGDRWDTFADPDLRLVVNAGRRRSVIWGPENSRGHTFSVPAVRLRRGQRLSIVVSDRDVTTDEHIGRSESAFEGAMPLRLSARYVDCECRLVDAGRVSERRASALAAVEPHVRAIEGAQPALDQPSLGRPDGAGRAAVARLTEAAAYTSWQGADTRALRRRFEEAQRAFDVRMRRAIADLRRAAPRRGQPAMIERGGELRVRAVECGARAANLAPVPATGARDRCVVHLDVRSSQDDAPSWLFPLDAISARGATHTPQQAVVFVERVDPTTVRVAAVFASTLERRGALLRAGEARRTFLRLD